MIKALENANGDKVAGNELIEQQEIMVSELEESKDEKLLKEIDETWKKEAEASAGRSFKDHTSSTSQNVVPKLEEVQSSQVSL